jgi:hypothetical protein
MFGAWNGGLQQCVSRRRCISSPITAFLNVSSKVVKQCYVSARNASSNVQSEKADAQTTTPQTALDNHQPPLPIRIALVSTTTALATPSFPALGFLYAVMRFTVPDANLRKAMEGRWGTLLSFTTWTLLPKLYHGTVASLILPCELFEEEV